MKYTIIDRSTGQKLFSTIDRNKAVVFFASLEKNKVNASLFICKADGKVLAKVA